MNEVDDDGDKGIPVLWWPLIAVLIAAVVVLLGVKAWNTGHDVAFAVLVLAAVVGLGFERLRIAIRESR